VFFPADEPDEVFFFADEPDERDGVFTLTGLPLFWFTNSAAELVESDSSLDSSLYGGSLESSPDSIFLLHFPLVLDHQRELAKQSFVSSPAASSSKKMPQATQT
jgi:hypothetical protein